MNSMPHVSRFFYLTLVLILAGFGVQKASAEMEIDMGDQNTAAAPAPTATPIPAQPTNTPVPKPTAQPTAAPAAQTAMTEPTDTPTPAPLIIHGQLKAKDIYDAGIKHYKEKDYEGAISYLKQAIKHKDPYTPKYIYAEAYATLGVIYQFYFPVHNHLTFAAIYYKDALKYEPNNPTARKYLKKLRKYSK